MEIDSILILGGSTINVVTRAVHCIIDFPVIIVFVCEYHSCYLLMVTMMIFF